MGNFVHCPAQIPPPKHLPIPPKLGNVKPAAHAKDALRHDERHDERGREQRRPEAHVLEVDGQVVEFGVVAEAEEEVLGEDGGDGGGLEHAYFFWAEGGLGVSWCTNKAEA